MVNGVSAYTGCRGCNRITAIVAAEDYVAGLDPDGGLHLLGSVGGLDRKLNWDDALSSIAAARNCVLGLTTDGKVRYHGQVNTG